MWKKKKSKINKKKNKKQKQKLTERERESGGSSLDTKMEQKDSAVLQIFKEK